MHCLMTYMTVTLPACMAQPLESSSIDTCTAVSVPFNTILTWQSCHMQCIPYWVKSRCSGAQTADSIMPSLLTCVQSPYMVFEVQLAYQEGFCCLLQGTHSSHLPALVVDFADCLSDLPDQPLERSFPQQQFCGPLILANLSASTLKC